MLAPGWPAHIVQRGNNRQRIFHGDGDFLFFRHCLHEARRLAAVRIHAYVLMPNHVHLLLTPEEPGAASRFMQSAARRYAGYFNRRQRRTGTMWEGRFYSTAILTDRYLFAVHRYIDQNPVRGGLVDVPRQYAWSSNRHYGEGEADSLLVAHPVIESLAREGAARESAYRALFERPLEEAELRSIRACTRRGRPLGAPPPRLGRPRKIAPAPANARAELLPRSSRDDRPLVAVANPFF